MVSSFGDEEREVTGHTNLSLRRVSLSSNRADSEPAILEQERHNASALNTSRAGNEDKELARHLRDMDEYLYVVSLRTTCLLTCM